MADRKIAVDVCLFVFRYHRKLDANENALRRRHALLQQRQMRRQGVGQVVCLELSYERGGIPNSTESSSSAELLLVQNVLSVRKF